MAIASDAQAAGDSGTTSPPVAEVYGHSPDTLYRLDPNTKAVTVVGTFVGCGQVIDIALDAASRLFATSWNALYVVQKETAICVPVATGPSYPNSLSFVPAGTVDPAVEALVGYVGGDYVRIDTTTGAMTTIGALGGGLTSSGDIVSVRGGDTFLTVKGPGCADCLVQVDPRTGALLKNLGALGRVDVFGMSFWGGQLYGFDNAGELFQLPGVTSGPLKTVDIAIPMRPAGLEFWGAGSTTSAPLQ
jgi:hypothetical protein